MRTIRRASAMTRRIASIQAKNKVLIMSGILRPGGEIWLSWPGRTVADEPGEHPGHVERLKHPAAWVRVQSAGPTRFAGSGAGPVRRAGMSVGRTNI